MSEGELVEGTEDSEEILNTEVLLNMLEDLGEEKKKVEESEEKYYEVINTSVDAILSVDPQLNLILWNPSAERIFGYKEKEVLGQSLLKIIPNGYGAARKRLFKESPECGKYPAEATTLELEGLRKNGEKIPVEVSISSRKVGASYIDTLVVRDITERKKAEQRIEHLNLVLSTIRNVNQLIVREKDREKLLAEICKTLIRERSYRSAWIVLLDESMKLIAIDAAGFEKKRFLPFYRRLKRGKLSSLERKVLKQKNVLALKNQPSKCAVPKEYGNREGMIIRLGMDKKVYGLLYVSIPPGLTLDTDERGLFREVAEDISFCLYNIELEESASERMEMLRENERRFRDLVENAQEWVWETDGRGKYTYVSPVVKSILGYKPEEILGKHFYDLFHPEERKRLKKAALKAFAEKRPFRKFINRNMHKNGKTVWLSTSGVPILDRKGRLLGYRGLDADVTVFKKEEKQ